MDLVHRRDFLKLAGTSAAFAAIGGKLALTSRFAGASVLKNVDSELAGFDGVFVFDQSVRRAMGSDFGMAVYNMPLGVFFPSSGEDVARAVRYALRKNLKVAMRGTGGAAYGQAQAKAGIVIDSGTLNFIKWRGRNVVDVGPGALWKEVSDFTLKKGMTPPVLPDTMYISVGGTLNAGGIGETSYRFGAQVDHVLELDVVTGEGELLTCSRNSNSDLFHMCLAGMGQCGLIVRARIQLVAAPQTVITRRFLCANHSSFLNDMKLIAENEPAGAIAGDLKLGADGKWTYVVSATSFGVDAPSWLGQISGTLDNQPVTSTYFDYANRNTAGYLKAVETGGYYIPHPYMASFLPEDRAGLMLDHLVSTPGAALGAVQIAVFPMINANFKQTLQMMPAGRLSFHIRIYRKALLPGTPQHLQMLELNEKDALPFILANGGKVYLPFSPLLSPAQRIEHFGQANFDALSLSKRKYDPQSVLTPGAGLF